MAWSIKRKIVLGVQYYFFRPIIRCRVSRFQQENPGSGRPPGENRSRKVTKYAFLQDTIIATLVGERLFEFGSALGRKSEGCGAALAIPSATTFVLGGVSELGPPRKVSTGTTRNNSHKHHTHHTLSPWRQTASSCSPATATLSLLNWSLTGTFRLLRTTQSTPWHAGFASTQLHLGSTAYSKRCSAATDISYRSRFDLGVKS